MEKSENKSNENNKSSSHRAFFERLYGNTENSSTDEFATEVCRNNEINKTNSNSVKKISKNEFYHNEQSDVSEKQYEVRNLEASQLYSTTLAPECRITKKEGSKEHKTTKSPSYNLQFCHQTFQVSMRPFYSSVRLDPLSIGFSAFLARKRRKDGKMRRQRTTFSNEQTLHLENEFRINEYISRNRRYELAECLQLTETQIKIWFQNRRAKDKRIEKAQLDQQYRNLLLSQRFFASPMTYHNSTTCAVQTYHNFT